MKKRLFLFALLFTSLLTACLSDDDDGEKWDASKVCPEEGVNAYGMPNRGTFTDERDGEVYRYTTIGDQVWMAENLRFALPYPYSFCYGERACYVHETYTKLDTSCREDTTELAKIAERMHSTCTDNKCITEEYCKKFGRYYSLKEDGGNYGLLDRAVVDSVCPKGWHVPSKAEWEILIGNIEGNLSRVLSDEDYLFEENDLHTRFYGSERNTCGFSLLYAGRSKSAEIEGLFDIAIYWTSVSVNPGYAYVIYIDNDMRFGTDRIWISLRCLKD